MPQIPRDRMPDSTLALGRDPYGFVAKRCRQHGTDLFQTRLLFQKTICMTGRDAAAIFYDTTRFARAGAAPLRLQKTLFGQRGVQTLDGEAHRRRKHMFLSLMSPQHIARLGDLADHEWRAYAQRWSAMDRVVLYDGVREILCRAVCAWSGVPLEEAEVGRRTRELTALFEQAGAVGPRHWWGRWARRKDEAWIGRLIEQIRAGEVRVAEDSAAHAVAWYRDLDGELLDPRVAAVELLNVLRPTVAVAVYLVFVAHALQAYPECRRQLVEGGEDGVEPFVQEVRRFYPFFPSVLAVVREDFEWRGYRFREGTRVILDLYGTNHDARQWHAPAEFRPERFREWDGDPFNFVPQGGGDHAANHRCPGEWIAIDLMKRAATMLTRTIGYDVPADQDLAIDFQRLPALPKSGFIISHVRTRS